MNLNPSVRKEQVQKYTKTEILLHEDILIIEEPLEIRLRYFRGGESILKRIAVTMRTPGDDENLIRGFLFSEGIISHFQEIDFYTAVAENIIEVQLKSEVIVEEGLLNRNFYTTSSCGVCGKASIESVYSESQYLPWSSTVKMKPSIVKKALLNFNSKESLFSITGGNHAVALFDEEGEMLAFSEDVGRHNAMDKLVGSMELPLSNYMVLLSGRASFELLQKAAKAGVPIVLSIGAPSTLALDLAKEHGITLVGFVKKDKFNVYCGERILM